MRRPNPACSLARADAILTDRKVAACGLDRQQEWGSAGVQISSMAAGRALTIGTDLDPRDLIGMAGCMAAAIVASGRGRTSEEIAQLVSGVLMDAIAQGYHARLLEEQEAPS